MCRLCRVLLSTPEVPGSSDQRTEAVAEEATPEAEKRTQETSSSPQNESTESETVSTGKCVDACI